MSDKGRQVCVLHFRIEGGECVAEHCLIR
jgi:hypothetical protein